MTERPIDHTREVHFEYMYGNSAVEAMRAFPVGYLPIGCLERHGDHLPMGLDILKAQGVCRVLAQAIGGVVLPPHFYSGIHMMTEERLTKASGEWANIYTDRTAQDHLIDVIRQFARTPLRVIVLYTGHYPECQVDMIQDIAQHFEPNPDMAVIPFAENMILQGDHSGISETSFMLYLDRRLVNMTGFAERNYGDHNWRGERDPKLATVARGEEGVIQVLDHLGPLIQQALEPA